MQRRVRPQHLKNSFLSHPPSPALLHYQMSMSAESEVCRYKQTKLLYDWRSVSQSVRVCLGVEPTLGLVTRYYFLSDGCCLVSVRRSLWREDGSAVCSAITQWSESRRARNHTSLSHLRFPQPGQSESGSLYGWQSVSQYVLVNFVDVLPDTASFQEFGSGICCLVSVGRPLWREAGSVLCKSQSSYLSGPGSHIYIPQEQGGPIIPPVTPVSRR
jgi:hypothetical protein